MRITLLGDSIFDNASYVAEGESLSGILNEIQNIDVNLLAVDGAVTADVCKQLESFPEKNALSFVSCGGNDALRSIWVLEEKAKSVGEALETLSSLRQVFRKNYQIMLNSILGKTNKLIVCSIYNEVPGLSESAKSALALFNEISMQEG